MSDDRNSPDEEYQYADVDLAQEVKQTPPEDIPPIRRKRSIFSTLMSSRILIPIAIVVAIFVVYQFLGRTSSEQMPDAASFTTDTPAQQAPVATTTKQAASQSTGQEVSDLLVQSDMVMSKELTSIKQQQAEDSASITQLQTEVRSANGQLMRMQQDLASVSAGISSLNSTLQKKATPTKTVRRAPRRAYKPRVVAPRVNYQLKSVVPGRAWLQGSNGSTQTVKVGDKLQGYGQVTAINTVQGRVVTSSGRTITYGPQDS